MSSRDHLVPEQRTDKNGDTRTRWVKPASAAKGKPALPAPRVTVAKPAISNEERRKTIIGSMKFFGLEEPDSRVDGLLTRTPPEQLPIVDEAISELTSKDTGASAKRRKYVTASIFRLCMHNTTVLAVNDLLQYREAFNSYWCQNNELEMKDVERIMFGIRSYKLPPNDDGAVTQNMVACIRFGYELKARFPDAPFKPLRGDVLPVGEGRHPKWTNVDVYADPRLANLVWAHHERVDEIIAFCAERQTSDVGRIKEMLEVEGSKAFAEGLL